MTARAIVTGAAGFMGSHLAQHLVNQGTQVLAIDDLSGGYRDFVPESPLLKFALLDLDDQVSLREAFVGFRPTVVYHLAAYAAEGLSPFIRRYNYQRNLLASASVINCCIEVDAKIVFTSSMAVYGNQPPPFTEDLGSSPVDPYGIAKAAVESDLRCAESQHGLRWSVIRPHNVVGVRQNIWDRYRNVLGIFVRKALAGEPLSVFGDGLQTRAFSHVSGYMDPFLQVADTWDGEVFNLGADNPVTILALAELVVEAAEAHGIRTRIEHLEARHEVRDAYCDHTKAKSLLSFNDATDLDQTVREVFSWALTQPSRVVESRPYELTRGLYDYWR